MSAASISDWKDSQRRLRDSLYDLYEECGLDLMTQAARGMKRDLIIRLKASNPHSDEGEIIHFYAVNRWDADDFFDEWAKPSIPMSPEAERIIGTTTAKLARCRPATAVMNDFFEFIDV